MSLVMAAMVGALTLAPAPSTATPLDVAVASTCDYLVISVFNPTKRSVVITPRTGSRAEPKVVVKPRTTVPINLPAAEGLRASVGVGRTTLGPWIWKAPDVCPLMGGSIVDEDNVKSGSSFVVRNQGKFHSVWYSGILLGLGLLLVGALGGLPWLWREELIGRFRKQPTGKHQKPNQPSIAREVRFEVKRRIVRRWMFSRR